MTATNLCFMIRRSKGKLFNIIEMQMFLRFRQSILQEDQARRTSIGGTVHATVFDKKLGGFGISPQHFRAFRLNFMRGLRITNMLQVFRSPAFSLT